MGKLTFNIGNLKNLTYLDLQNGAFSNIKEDYLRSLSKLTYLNLAGNPDMDWNPLLGAILEMENLEYLNIAYNNIQMLPGGLGGAKLKYLNLSGNAGIVGGPLLEDFGGLEKLTHLYLAEVGLKGLTSIIEQCPRLMYLDFSNNGMETVPTEIKNLHQLEVLHLSQNKMVTLPATLAEMPALRQLPLKQCNELEKQEFGALLEMAKNLEVVDLTGSTNITKSEVAEWQGKLSNLKLIYE
jgi:Leucine-rich repeat (LRR) protein